ncbi:HNH endonuclease [Citrobacter freundii]|uniref:HNH endonuclease n=1 Tax=Citrobacter freundii TaxID=546 RepID=UPI0034D75AE7
MKQKFIEWFTKNNNGCSPAMEDDRSFVYEMTQHMFEAYQAGVAEGEARCAALAAENAGLKNPENWLSQSDYGYEASEVATQNGATEDESLRAGMIAIINRIGTPATDTFLAEVKREATEPLEKEIEELKKNLLMSVGDIRDLVDYNPETGVLTAKANFSGRQAGSVIGSQTWQGYYAFSLFGKKCFAHRLAWLLHYGEWPSQPIDHINGIKTDNSIRNLRLCSLSQNQFNKPTQKNNTTGVKGVYWNKRDKRYVASVQFNGKKYSAGHHKDIENAKEAVMKLREKLAREFTNHGEFELAAQLRKGAQS